MKQGKKYITTSFNHELRVKKRIPIMTVKHVQCVCRNGNPEYMM